MVVLPQALQSVLHGSMPLTATSLLLIGEREVKTTFHLHLSNLLLHNFPVLKHKLQTMYLLAIVSMLLEPLLLSTSIGLTKPVDNLSLPSVLLDIHWEHIVLVQLAKYEC